MSMLVDPLFEYASKHSAVESSLPRLASIDKASLDSKASAALFSQFKESAESGSAFSMCVCSRLCREGVGCQRSDQEALSWAERAAASCFPPGYYELAACHERGIGVKANISEAVRYYQMAACAGFGFASYRLALLYHLGNEVPRDDVAAQKWIGQAIDQGEAMAVTDLAAWYEFGDGVPKDFGKAAQWYAKAAEIDDPAALMRLSSAYLTGDLGLPMDKSKSLEYSNRLSTVLAAS